ncbi:MAG: non-canonical purine NTP pyrophosphatase [Desulfuromonas sp.]|nr:MAG: non-canonical purine NTP pyrophosphatase [Desulfuromonas sp.]
MKELVVATGNKGKLREISRLLEQCDYLVIGLDAFPDAPSVVEDGDTFAANARKKAEAIAVHSGKLTLADDSGLVVECLSGAPGVHSARYAGATATDADNNAKLLREMEGIPDAQRGAAFCCVMALVAPDRSCRIFAGELKGTILQQPQGDGGFGYDPLFMVREYGKSLAELPLDLKNRISHRGQALKKLMAELEG